MTMDSYRSKVNGLTEPVLGVFETLRISPDMLSAISLFFAALSGVAYYFGLNSKAALVVALFALLLNGVLDALDGALARKMGTASRYGDFIDHVIDRYADVFMISGIFLGGFLSTELGALAIVGVLLNSYLGTQAQAVGIGRVYGGLMGRADRMIVLLLATCVNLVYPAKLGLYGIEFPVLGWALLLIGVLSHITAMQRVRHTRRILLENGKK